MGWFNEFNEIAMMCLLGACSTAVNHIRLLSPEDGVGHSWNGNSMKMSILNYLKKVSLG